MTITGILPVSGVQDLIIDSLSGGSARPLQGFGFRVSISNVVNGDDVWPGTATTLPIPPDAGEQMTVVSTSASDTAAGTGVRTIMIHYLDASGNPQTETITTNGVTGVNTVAVNIRFVQDIHALTVGSNGLAVGTVTIATTGTPTNIYTQIQPGTNRSLSTARMVPLGKVLVIRSFSASGGAAAGGKSADIRLRITSHHGLLLARVFQFQDNFLAFNSGTFRTYDPPIIVPAFTIVKCTAYATAAGSDVQSSWNGVLIPTPN